MLPCQAVCGFWGTSSGPRASMASNSLMGPSPQTLRRFSFSLPFSLFDVFTFSLMVTLLFYAHFRAWIHFG